MVAKVKRRSTSGDVGCSDWNMHLIKERVCFAHSLVLYDWKRGVKSNATRATSTGGMIKQVSPSDAVPSIVASQLQEDRNDFMKVKSQDWFECFYFAFTSMLNCYRMAHERIQDWALKNLRLNHYCLGKMPTQVCMFPTKETGTWSHHRIAIS